jgi:hypothetical protein
MDITQNNTFYFIALILLFSPTLQYTMEENDFQITLCEYWKNTIKSSEAALAMLSVFEGKQVEIVDNAITSLRTLVNQGQNYQSLIQQNNQQLQQQQQQQEQEQEQQQQQQQQYVYGNFDRDPCWKQIDSNTFEVPLGKGTIATCIAVNTVEQLDQLIKDIYQAPYIAIDCEFLGVKKNMPELKLLQIGVSSSKGYAIQVDILGVQVITEKLKPVLEDGKLNIVGWSYRSDAMAIESYFKKITHAPVLDLQSKLLSVAVETMNLATAMNKYAQAWEGLDVFQKAKQFGGSFGYTNDQCIWLLDPLPPRALVYAVFDVLSVHALYQLTKELPHDESNYWPLTVINNMSAKALDRFHRQRAKGISSTPTSTSSSPQVTGNGKGKAPFYGSPSGPRRNYKKAKELPVPVSPQPETNDGYDDNDARYTRAIQKAIALSVQEPMSRRRQAAGEGNSSSDRVVGTLEVDEFEYSQFADSLDETPAVTTRITFAENVVDVPKQEMAAPSWGDVNLDQQPFIGGQFRFNAEAPGFVPRMKSADISSPSTTTTAATTTTPTTTTAAATSTSTSTATSTTIASPSTPVASINTTNTRTNTNQKPSAWKNANEYSDFKKQQTWQQSPRQQQQQQYRTPKEPYKHSPSAASPATQFKSKPSKEEYDADFKLRLSKGDQTGSFTWDTGVDGNSMTAASWKNFASTTEINWKLGNDTEVDAMEKATVEAAAKQEQRKAFKFNTVVGAHTSSQVGGPVGDTATGTMHEDDRDNWNIQQEMPDTMVMPMNQLPIRKKFSGPRIMNPYDGDYDGDDYSDDDDQEEQETEVTKQESSLEDLPIFADDIFLYGDKGNSELTVLKLTAPEHLDMIQIPPAGTQYSVTVGFHVVDGKNGALNLKALQLYLSTGASYTCVLEQACLWNYRSKLKSTRFGKLLTDPLIKRICWYPKYIEQAMIEKLGFPLGNCIDLSNKVNQYAESLDSRADAYSFKAAVDRFLKDWPNLEQYNEIKNDFDSTTNSKSFSGSRWDRAKLPEVVLKYSAFQGLTAYALYQLSKTFGLDDQDFLYKSTK